MEKVTFESIAVDRCTGCYGMWFDALELEAMVETRGGRKLDVGSVDVGKQMDATNRIDCPHCHTKMLRLVDNRHPEVKYEQCSVCGGAFLDAGELKLIERRTLSELLADFLSL
jgi:Zn-finger nucleic acid-binding protein